MSTDEQLTTLKHQLSSLIQQEEGIVVRYNNADNPILRASLYDELKKLKAQELALEMAIG